jgi:AraC family transcriptional activator of tynA and feaB
MNMHRMWSTADVAQVEATSYWSEALLRLMPGLEFEPACRNFEAEMHTRNICGLDVNLVRAAPQIVRGTSRPRGQLDGQFALIYLRSGRLRAQQFSRSVDVAPGECILLDGSENSEVHTCAMSESLNIVLPAMWVGQWLVRPENEVAKVFTTASMRARPFLQLLDLVASGDLPDLGGGLLLNQIAVGEVEVGGTTHASRLLNRIMQVIWRRSGDHEFSPQAAADEVGISRRYLVSLFQGSGTTFNTELMRVRLDRASQMLRDSRFESLSVMEVSLRCGFSDASHFSKRFKERFAVPPAAYRDGQQQAIAGSTYELTFH